MKEEWRAITGFSRYRVSNIGRVTNRRGLVLKPHVKKDSRGANVEYLRVRLRSDSGVYKNLRIHRLVLLAFVGPPPSEKHVGAHIDGNSRNNWLMNLKWATPKENEKDKAVHGTKVFGTAIPNAKLNPAAVRRIRKLAVDNKLDPSDMLKLVSALGVSRHTIRDVLRGRTWSHVV